LAEDERPPDASAETESNLDAQVEDLTRRIADVVNSAGVERRQDLREYAIDLLKEETERSDVPPSSSPVAPSSAFSPLAMAVLLVLAALPLLLLGFTAFIGLALLAVAALMAGWGVVAILLRPRSR
jgi:hypothetical protein